MPKYQVLYDRRRVGAVDAEYYATLNEAQRHLVTLALQMEPGDCLSLSIGAKKAPKPAPKSNSKRPSNKVPDGRTALAAYLAEFGISVTAFAAQIKKSPSTVSRIATGETRPTPETARDIVRVTNAKVTLSDLFGE